MKINDRVKGFCGSSYVALASNMALLLLLFSVCRLVFYIFNLEFYPDMSARQLCTIFAGGIRFDLSALLWGNIAYVALFIIPFKFRYNAFYQKALKVFFVSVNAVLFAGNCTDVIYFKFTLRRTTADVFREFANESNYGELIGRFIVDFWYMWLIWIGLVAAVALLYRKAARPAFGRGIAANVAFYAGSAAMLAVVALLCVVGMRGGVNTIAHPLRLNDAVQYTKKPLEMCIVQNTPFCIFRTLGKRSLTRANFFDSQEALEAAYNPVIAPSGSGAAFNPMNVVIIIWESLSREHVGSLNRDLANGRYTGYTPFVDTLIAQGLTFTSSYANGRKSIEAMPSALAGIPSLHVPFISSAYSGNMVNSVASLLKRKGYSTSFFHGSLPAAMGFWTFAQTAGFDVFFGESEYGDKRDHDGTWGIWDEEFLQFMALKLSEQRQPFCSAVFTISSHHPFTLPERYDGVFPEVQSEQMIRCIGYTDFAVRRFFETAKKQAWYSNTLFVLTADHANKLIFPESQNSAGQMAVPIIFFTPNGSVRGMVDNVAQQTDILPTIMGILRYDEPFVAFGQDAINQSKENFAINFANEVYHVFYRQYLLLFDGKKSLALYDVKRDRMMQNSILAQHEEVALLLENKAKGFIQQYNNRMIDNCLTIDCDKPQAQ
ncbi:MAG: sulfatase-like hydrolase/transferase [Prevotellaceae bacterium]|jgi:arylsulfatase A-like enzyme|nr:sulfatase-like hydrolase/transferase [Prevotellaceae bacterium]